MSKLKSLREWLVAHEDLFMDMVRIYLGTGLFVKAVWLMFHTEYLYQLVNAAGVQGIVPAAIAHYVIVGHLAGGGLLALGLFTRLAAVAQVPILLGAVFYVYLPKLAAVEPVEARQNLEFSAFVLFLLVLFSVRGAGRFSLDYYLWRQMKQRQPETAEAAPQSAQNAP